MNMRPSIRPRQGLPLVTPETCGYRRPVSNGSQDNDVVCGLLLKLLPEGTAASTCHVSRDVCAACCRSSLPDPGNLNPVVGSALYNATGRLLAELAGTHLLNAPAARDHAALLTELRTLAERAISAIPSREHRIAPARARTPCVYLGPPIDAGLESRKCRHPRHDTTTLEQCHGCLDWLPEEPAAPLMTLGEMVPRFGHRSGPRVREWAVGITTSPRAEPTLDWCLDSVRRAGWPDPRIFVDGAVPIADRHHDLPVTWRDRRLGAWPAYDLALSEMLMRQPSADAYLLIQDDAVLFDRANLREYLESTLWPGLEPGLVSLYCSSCYTTLEPGWRAIEEPWLWGALAFVFPNQLAREFISEPQVSAQRWTSTDFVGIDGLLGQWASRRRVAVWFPQPSLVQHVGNVSTIWQDSPNDGPRRADWFAGDIDVPFEAGSTLDDFPEHKFPCSADRREQYASRISNGRRRMRETTAVFCGLCRNVRHFLPRLEARIARTGSMFRDYRVVLFENDSSDRTLHYLLNWQDRDSRVHVLTETLGVRRFAQTRSLERATWMAEYRNRYRTFVAEHYRSYDVAVVIDTDLAGGWSYDGLAHTFGHEDWDFVGSYGLLKRREPRQDGFAWLHFDTWAFRLHHNSPFSAADPAELVLRRGDPMLRVQGCFGGLGVYRLPCLLHCEYGGHDMEHAVLHERMRERGFGRQFLNPSQIALYSPP